MKKSTTLVLISVIFFLEKSFSQFNPVWTENYQHTTSNNFSNESRKVVADAAGNAFVLSDVTSNIDPAGNPGTTTYHYTVISKYSPTGSLIISKSLNVIDHFVSGFNNKGAFGLEIDGTGNVYIGFSTYSAITGFDANIVKYNSNLVRLWAHTYNPLSIDRGVDMAISSGGIVYAIVECNTGGTIQYNVIKAMAQFTTDTSFYSFVAGTDVLNQIISSGNNIYMTGYRVIAGFKNVLSAKINSSAVLKWQKTFNGGSAARDDIGNNLTMGSDGYIYITGSSDQGVPTGNDVIFMKLQDSNGARLWARYRDFNHSLTDAGYFIDAADPTFVYAGSVTGNTILLERLEKSLGNSGGFVNYIPLPASPYSSVTGIALTDMKVSPNFGFYLTGNVVATNMSSQAFTAAFLVKFKVQSFSRPVFKMDSEMPVEGDFNNSRTASGIAFDLFKDDIYWLRDLYSTYSTHLTETVVLTDIDMVSPIREASGISSPDLNAGEILIYPNPSNGIMSVTTNEKIKMIELFNIAGQHVKTINTSSENVTLDLSGLMRGIYLGRIYLESGNISVRKIIRN